LTPRYDQPCRSAGGPQRSLTIRADLGSISSAVVDYRPRLRRERNPQTIYRGSRGPQSRGYALARSATSIARLISIARKIADNKIRVLNAVVRQDGVINADRGRDMLPSLAEEFKITSSMSHDYNVYA
jgi:hypothetical protein